MRGAKKSAPARTLPRRYACLTLARGAAGSCARPWRPGEILTFIGPVRQPCVLCRIHDDLMDVWIAEDSKAGVVWRESQIDPRTNYEKLKGSTKRHELFEGWAFDLYEEAGCDIERAVALLPESCSEPEDEHLIETHLRLMETRMRDSVVPWLEMLDAVCRRRGMPLESRKAPLAERASQEAAE